MSWEPALVGALVAGLAGTPHCIGMCGPLATAAAGSAAEIASYHLGKLVTYAALGAMAGALGSVSVGPSWVPRVVAAVLLVIFAARLAGWPPVAPARPNTLRHSLAAPFRGVTLLGVRLAGKRGPLARLAFGLVNGLLPCGLVYAALALPISTGSAATGALAMTAFGLGTVPGLFLAGATLHKLATSSRMVRPAMAALVLASGLFTLAMRGGHGGHSAPSEAPACHHQAP